MFTLRANRPQRDPLYTLPPHIGARRPSPTQSLYKNYISLFTFLLVFIYQKNGIYLFISVNELVKSVKEDNDKHNESALQKVKFFTYKLRYPILFAFLIAAFNQLSGINIILYFAPRLLGLAGIEDPVQASILLGITNLVATFIGIRLIDMLGRKTLLIIGCVGYIASLSVCTYSFFS